MLKQRFTGIPARVTFPGVSAWSTWSMDFYARAPRNGAGSLAADLFENWGRPKLLVKSSVSLLKVAIWGYVLRFQTTS